MNKRKKKTIFGLAAVLMLLAPSEAKAQLFDATIPGTKMTLEQCFQLADKQNLTLQTGRKSIERAKVMEGTAWDEQKTTQRKNRGRMIRVALVGYTNVGKSTIMNLLSKSEVFAENKLFATLDTTVRKVVVDNLPFLLADTVGFIRKLPTDLVDSFKSTLDETREADLLLHVVDISHPDFEEQIQVVEKTLEEIGCSDKPSMIIFNKIDNYSWVEKEEDDLTPMDDGRRRHSF